jgi:sialic acid synthase SpsE
MGFGLYCLIIKRTKQVELHVQRKKTFIVAELGNTHEGSVGLAKQMILAAADCGADAVKFQTHIFQEESLPNAPNPSYFKGESRQAYFERTAFSLEQLHHLKQYAEEECRVQFLSSPFSVEAVNFLEKLDMALYKVPSGEVTNTLLLKRMAETGKPVFLSSGMSSWQELDDAVEVLRDNGCKELSVLQCTSKYPCPPQDAGLNLLNEIRQRYDVEVGFSDHTLGVSIPLAAVTLGASIVEKHFTLSTLMYGSDAKNSMEPSDFKSMVDGIRSIEAALNAPLSKDDLLPDLTNMKEVFEKSLVSTRAIKQGELFTKDNVSVKKPGTGIPAKYFPSILGKPAAFDVEADYLLQEKDISGFSAE